jgi:hypothetical protein
VQKTFDGSQAVEIAFDENTMTAKEVNGVLEIGAKGTIPESLPQTASALKSGSLPPTGWVVGAFRAYWQGEKSCSAYNGTLITTNKAFADKCWSSDTGVTLKQSTASMQDAYNSNASTWAKQGIYTFFAEDTQQSENGLKYSDAGNSLKGIFVMRDGRIYGKGIDELAWQSMLYVVKLGFADETEYNYTISDTDIIVNSDVLMELTDEGGVKALSIGAGAITVVRDSIPTSNIPYTYKVKQTNASGQFTVLNHYVPNVPVTSVNGQTGAVTIAVPTKTSQLTNDSDYVSNLPTVQDVVCNDVDSATTLDTTITCEVGDLILAQIIVRSALTLPTGWTLLRTIPAVETSVNQTLSFAYKRATSTSETLTVTQASAGRIYTNLVRLSNAVSISYIQSCEKTGTGIKSISSTKPVTANMVIWGASSDTWATSSPYGDWTYAPSTLDYYSLSQSTRAPRLGTFVDSSGAGERTFTILVNSADSLMCGAVEIVGDEVARKGDIPTKTSQLTNDSGFVKASETNTFTGVQTFSNADGIKTDRVHNLDNDDAWYNFDGSNNRFGSPSRPTIIRTSEARPRAQVPSGETTVTKEIALLEDVQGSEWAVNNDNSVFPKNGWYLISSMVVGSYQLAPFIALVTSQNNKLVVVTQDLEGHDVTLAMTIGNDRKFADAIRVHTYTIANNAITATSASLSITTLLTDGQFSFDYKLLY